MMMTIVVVCLCVSVFLHPVIRIAFLWCASRVLFFIFIIFRPQSFSLFSGGAKADSPLAASFFSLSAVFAAQQRRQLRLSLCLCHRFIRFLPFPHSVFRRAFLQRVTRVLRSISVSSSAVCLCPSLFRLRGVRVCLCVSVISFVFFPSPFSVFRCAFLRRALECCSLSRFLSPRSVSVPLCLVVGGCGGCPPACLICDVSLLASFSAVGLCPSVFGGFLAPDPLCLVLGGCLRGVSPRHQSSCTPSPLMHPLAMHTGPAHCPAPVCASGIHPMGTAKVVKLRRPCPCLYMV